MPLLTETPGSDAFLVRVTALYCLSDLAEEYPRQVTPAADAVVPLLDPDSDEGVLEAAIPYVAAVADVDPGAVLDAVPKLAALLQADTPCEQDAVVALTRVAKAHPGDVLPVVRELQSYVDDEGRPNRVATLATLGYVTKEFPNAAESTVPTVVDLLDADSARLRANAAGLLADEYPREVRSAVPRAIELLTDEDRNARYNATSILERVAKEYPADVEPGVGALVDVLNDDFTYTRTNACWALGYLRVEAALELPRELEQSDPDDEVRNVAGWAVEQIDG